MKHQDLLNELRNLLVALVLKIEGAAAMQMYDINIIAEGIVLGLFRELYGFAGLRNLNASERKNYPGVDLADPTARIAIQVTATPALEKVKDTVSTFLRHGLHKTFDRLIIYVISRKQNSYSQAAIDSITAGSFCFNTTKDILDYRDLLERASFSSPSSVRNAVGILNQFNFGGSQTSTDTTFDPPSAEVETVAFNLVEVFFPPKLFIASLVPEIVTTDKGRRRRNDRDKVRDFLKLVDRKAPSDYEVSERRIITFHNLEERPNAFDIAIDPGTVTVLSPREFYSIDEDHERIFKSLLRRALQQKLYKENVRWLYQEGLFAFMPREEGELIREEVWIGHRQAKRRVFEKKLNKKDPTKVFVSKHFAFGVDFLTADGSWYAALTPDWYFSYGDDYRRSHFADKQLSWLKRKEVNRTVTDHFRFLVFWLKTLDTEDLFSSRSAGALSFGDIVRFNNHPKLYDDKWLPVKEPTAKDLEPLQDVGIFNGI